MPPAPSRHIELLNLGHALRRHAAIRLGVGNAASFVVHQVLAAAFARGPGGLAGRSLETSLRADIDRRLDAHRGSDHV